MSPDRERITVASEAACPDDYIVDMSTTGSSPPRPSPPNNVVPSQEATGHDTAVAPLAQELAQGTVTAASTIRALDGDDPPIPLLHVVDPEKETEGNVSDGPQLHVGPPGPPRFPLEFDDSLAKRVDGLEQHLSDLADPPGPPPCFPNEFDDSLAKRADNELERNRSDHAGDNVSTARSTMGASVASTAEAAVGPSMVEGVEEGSTSSRVSAPSMSSQTELGEANPAAGLNPLSEGRSTFIAEAYRVEEVETPGVGTVYEAELAEPNVVLRFYQRRGFASVVIAVTLFLVGIAVAAVVLLSKNLPSDDRAETSSVATDLQIPVPTNVPTVTVTDAPTINPPGRSMVPTSQSLPSGIRPRRARTSLTFAREALRTLGIPSAIHVDGIKDLTCLDVQNTATSSRAQWEPPGNIAAGAGWRLPVLRRLLPISQQQQPTS
ncbi:hypothetical protein THAOC_06302 [Thalassiosira oceanica]|uniref:Transmembrane protein n=1 Tax=Thalassiosira oceanica TaxID=159749 RepID=K0T526_THAOC|nr:hypothetical protein THAOC_06302 [Thalassiosira oceanica]|eukprot:EJK72189.1 hypothetical protein THAOC_06302 [Thalassiosira oceanica]